MVYCCSWEGRAPSVSSSVVVDFLTENAKQLGWVLFFLIA